MQDTAIAALIAASLATAGWVYTARRARTLSRKQHTITVLLQANFNKEIQDALSKIRPFGLGQNFPPTPDEELVNSVRRILNYNEFLAAGLRNGDFDEQLVKDTERTKIVNIYEIFKAYIWSLRNDRNRMSLYEHLEWLHARWSDQRAHPVKRLAERIRQKPFQGSRHNHRRSVAG
jgi:hypothetical protein